MSTQAFDLSVDLLQTLLWQYNEATALQTLLDRKQKWFDKVQQSFWTDWVSDVFDLTTANEFGLSVWAAILDVPLVVVPAEQLEKPLFGFGALGNVGFSQGNFASAQMVSSLLPEQRRLVLRLRYFQLTTRGAVPEVNAFLAQVFGEGTVYVEDLGNMQARYVFTVKPSSAVELVLTEFDVLPRPAGVSVEYVTP
jgi:hypothetical protein